MTTALYNHRRSLALATFAACIGLVSISPYPAKSAPEKDDGNVDVLTAEEKNGAVDKPVVPVKPAVQTPAERAAALKAAKELAAAQAEEKALASALHVRARITTVKPDGPVSLLWRYGGEAMGGEVIKGTFGDGLKVGEWSQPVSTRVMTKGVRNSFFLTVFANPMPAVRKPGKPLPPPEPLTGMVFELEFLVDGKPIKTVTANSPAGATGGFVIPGQLLGGGAAAQDAAVLSELVSLQEYAEKRAKLLEQLPWANKKLPSKLNIVTDLGGYGVLPRYGTRQSDPAIVESELRTLRQLGVNGLRAMPSYLSDEMKSGKHRDFANVIIDKAAGYPVARTAANEPIPGCANAPGIQAIVQSNVDATMTSLLSIPANTVYALTVDEIGSVYDAAKERQGHMAVCPYCIEAYQKWLQQKGGLQPQQFGVASWDKVVPINFVSQARPYEDPVFALNFYYSRAFNIESSAKLFTPMRQACYEANLRKKAAIAAGKLDSAEAKQPWVFSYALRGNTFLMAGHGLDFFEFYRQADNAMVYETSNRDPRVWEWDSFLCDVGRSITAEQKLKFGIYIKPHRGAPVQRALSALSRGADMLYWYTYGPDYFKGDSFSSYPAVLESTSKAAHLIGSAEEALTNTEWMVPAEVAILQPFTQYALRINNDGNATWEDTKWTYSALAHSHIPVDAIDEGMLLNKDLSRYKVIYLPSQNLRNDAAAKLAAWVQNGGTLVTHAGGLARDESNQPLKPLAPAIGLTNRSVPETWFSVVMYFSLGIQPYPDPKNPSTAPQGMAVQASKFYDTTLLPLTVGREKLQPAADAEVLAQYADGGAASIRHKFGKGWVYVNGFYPGFEYSIPTRKTTYNMDTDFSAAARDFIAAPARAAGVRPVVDASSPTIEAVLLKNQVSGARSVTVTNWGYSYDVQPKPVVSILTKKNVKIAIRGAGPVKEVRSAWLSESLPFKSEGDVVTVTLPSLEEGDVLLLK